MKTKKIGKLIILAAMTLVAVFALSACSGIGGFEWPWVDKDTMAISKLKPGDLVRDSETTYNDAAIVWKVAAQNYAGYSGKNTTLISSEILTLHSFGAPEPLNENEARREYGSNRWKYSDIRQWLNSDAKAGEWYEPQHAFDAPPSNDVSMSTDFIPKGGLLGNVSMLSAGYESEAGFLNKFSASFLKNVNNTTYSVDVAEIDGGGTEKIADKFFFASATETGVDGDAAFPIFLNNVSRKALVTQKCYDTFSAVLGNSKGSSWWLRDAFVDSAESVLSIEITGLLNRDYYAASYAYGGVRPVCNLKNSVRVSKEPDKYGVYDIVF